MKYSYAVEIRPNDGDWIHWRYYEDKEKAYGYIDSIPQWVRDSLCVADMRVTAIVIRQKGDYDGRGGFE